MKKFLSLILLFWAFACHAQIADEVSKVNQLRPFTTQDSAEIARLSEAILQAILQKKDAEFVKYVHPKKGLIISEDIAVDSTKFLRKSEIEKALAGSGKDELSSIYLAWGEETLPLRKYLRSIIEPKFLTSKTTVRQMNDITVRGVQGSGVNEMCKNQWVYRFFYVDGEWDGSNHKCILLAFEPYQGKKYLVRIIHDHWTP